MLRFWVATVALVFVSFPTVALAAGYEYPENGAKGLAQGGAFAADPTDATALYFNPAGLARQGGWRVLLDGHFVWLDSTFQRQGPNGEAVGQEVSNAEAPWIAPFVGASYGGLVPNLTIAVGVYGPAAYGSQRYPDPREIMPEYFNGDPADDPDDPSPILEEAPQRYALIASDLLVIYPSLAVAYAPTDWFSFGVTGQLVISHTKFSQGIYGGATPGESPGFEGVAELDVKGELGYATILGATVKPVDVLSLGVSWRPGFTVQGEGTLDVTFNDFLLSAFGLEQTRNDARFATTFPDVIRFGAKVEKQGLGGEFNAVWEGWSVVEEFVIEPDVEILLGDEPIPVEDIHVPKNWRDTLSLRFGLFADMRGLGVEVPLVVRAGYLFEQGSAPTSTLNLDFPGLDRNQFTLGVSYDFGFLSATLTGSHIMQARTTVRHSLVTQSIAPPPGIPPYPPVVVGTGVYDASYTMVVLGLEARFGQ